MPDYTQIARKYGLHWLLLALGLALCCFYAYSYYSLPEQPKPSAIRTDAPLAWTESGEPPVEVWNVFQPAESAPVESSAGPLAQRFRLAGTFFSYADATADANDANRRAIIDDLEKKQQYLVGEGDEFDGIRVVHIFRDRITLNAQGQEEDLLLSYAGMTPSPASSSAGGRNALASADQDALETGRFGKRIGENRWVFQRDELLKYYQELMDDPERMASIFLSMKPDYGGNGQIGGYYLDIEGEKNFFTDVGLRPKDIVRKVNSMKMTSQARAEYFIGEFLQNRMSAVVMEIERDGKPEKLIYLLR